MDFTVVRDSHLQSDWPWWVGDRPAPACEHSGLFPGVAPDAGGAWETRRSCSSLSLALVAGSSVSQVADNNCQMVLLRSNKLSPKQGGKPSLEAEVWTKHTGLERTGSSCIAKGTKQAPEGNARG